MRFGRLLDDGKWLGGCLEDDEKLDEYEELDERVLDGLELEGDEELEDPWLLSLKGLQGKYSIGYSLTSEGSLLAEGVLLRLLCPE